MVAGKSFVDIPQWTPTTANARRPDQSQSRQWGASARFRGRGGCPLGNVDKRLTGASRPLGDVLSAILSGSGIVPLRRRQALTPGWMRIS